jgi:hypothetical protein
MPTHCWSRRVGGAVRYITPQPSLTDFSAYARTELAFTQGGAPSYEAGYAAGGPIIDGTLGARASVWYRRDGGWIDRSLEGRPCRLTIIPLRKLSSRCAPARSWGSGTLPPSSTTCSTLTPRPTTTSRVWTLRTRRYYRCIGTLPTGRARSVSRVRIVISRWMMASRIHFEGFVTLISAPGPGRCARPPE